MNLPEWLQPKPVPLPPPLVAPQLILRCVHCRRLVQLIEFSDGVDDLVHAEDCSAMCRPIGVFRE